MARTKRQGSKVTFSVSVAPRTKEALKRLAARRFGGNVSAVIESIVVEAQRQQALDTLLDHMPPMSDEAFEAFMRELKGVPEATRAPRRAAGTKVRRRRAAPAGRDA